MLSLYEQKAIHQRRITEQLPILIDPQTKIDYFVIDDVRYNLYTDLVGNPIYSSLGE